ncbi:MAG: hypothetical protein KF861_01760 [Planctomycetaceae bacterium]|nr:hypothetical protein [Planctomycetaceae bacterium]
MSLASAAATSDDRSTTIASDRRAARVLQWSLRIFGSVDLLALVAVVMPVAWLHAGHALCGLGPFPAGPLPVYLARSTSMLYAFHGAILWFLSTDVRRFAPVIRFIASVTVLFGIAMIIIDVASGIPPWWTWSEGPLFAASGVWLLMWTSRLNRDEGC